MMHLTKQHPKYPSQYDTDLLSYYQFNASGPAIYDNSGNANTAELIGSTITRANSTGPFGGGQSEALQVTAIGRYDFSDPGVSLVFDSSPVPNGPSYIAY